MGASCSCHDTIGPSAANTNDNLTDIGEARIDTITVRSKVE